MGDRLPTLLVLALLAACGPKSGQPAAAGADDRVPGWKTEDGRVETWHKLARYYIDNGLPSEALEMVQRLQDAGHSNVELDLIKGRALAAQGLPDEAQVLLDDVRDKRPRDPRPLRALAVVHADRGEPDKALEYFERALKLDPTDAPTQNNVAFLQLSVGRCEEAVSHAEQAVALDAAVARYRNNLAFALVCTGDGPRALRLLRTTHRTEADARFDMGVAYERLDAVDAAVLHYRKALQSDPDHEAAQAALDRLTSDGSADTEPPDPGAEP